MQNTFPVLDGKTCYQAVFSGLAFIEKLKIELPETYALAKKLAQRTSEPVKPYADGGMVQSENCVADARSMKGIIDGLASK